MHSIPDNEENNYKMLILADGTPTGAHSVRYSKPFANEVTDILDIDDFKTRDIVLRLHNNQLKHINDLYPPKYSLQYPQMFCCCEDRYNSNSDK